MDNFFYDNVVFWFELKILVGGVVFCGMAILEVNIYFEVYFMLGLFDVMVVEEELELQFINLKFFMDKIWEQVVECDDLI